MQSFVFMLIIIDNVLLMAGTLITPVAPISTDFRIAFTINSLVWQQYKNNNHVNLELTLIYKNINRNVSSIIIIIKSLSLLVGTPQLSLQSHSSLVHLLTAVWNVPTCSLKSPTIRSVRTPNAHSHQEKYLCEAVFDNWDWFQMLFQLNPIQTTCL